MRALVTGGNGHLGYNLVKTLLDGGHTVRASVRSLADAAKTAPLRQLGAMELVEAELDRPDQLRGKRFNVSNRRARELLGWAPKIGLEDSLRDTMAALRARKGLDSLSTGGRSASIIASFDAVYEEPRHAYHRYDR